MALSKKLSNSFSSIYSSYIKSDYTSSTNNFKYIEVNIINKKEFILPLFHAPMLLGCFSNDILSNNLQSLKYLIHLKYFSIHSTATFLQSIGYLFSDSNLIFKWVSPKKEIFYIGKGVIFNSDFIPLLLFAVGIQKEDSSTNSNPICYINPKVFISTDTYSKYILKNIIPYYISNNVYINIQNLNSRYLGKKVDIIIKDCSDMIIHPNKPISGDFHSTILNQEGIIDSIIDHIK